jgi:hypothetical protein
VRKTRARAIGAAGKVILAGLLAPLILAACTGPDLISLGGKVSEDQCCYLSPTGDDHNLGTIDSPWKTFAYALPKLAPGDALELLPGTYDAASTKTLNVRCGPATADSTVPDAVLAKSGALNMPITVAAYKERQAFLRGDGKTPPVSIDGCAYWSLVGLRVEAQDDQAAAQGASPNPDSGSVVVLDGANDTITLEHLLLRNPNRYLDSDLLRIGDGAAHVTVDRCELYDFHHTAVEARRSSSLLFQLNYINSRGTHDPDGLSVSDDPTRGDFGVVLEETNNVYVENNIVEDVAVGFAVLGRGPGVPASVSAMPINHNWLLGNIVYQPARIGFRIDSQCAMANPCDDPHTLSDTELANDIVVGGALGISDAGSVGTKIDKVSVIDAARGVSVIKEPQNFAIPASMATTNTLVSGFQSVAFFADVNLKSWDFAHCAVAGGYDATLDFEPDDPARVIDKVMTTTDAVGVCRAYIPQGSPLRTGAVNDVGANVIYAYDAKGQEPMTDVLWTPAFKGCGATVTGVNDTPSSCETVNQTLQAHTQQCPLPQ